MVKNAFFTEIVLHIQVLDRMFYRAEQMGTAQNTVFVRKIWWITAFKTEDE